MKNLVEERWDEEYTGDRYIGDPPIPFVAEILKTLRTRKLMRSKGLYIGCGNGRNYIPLVDEGLDLVGLDISTKALEQISKWRPQIKHLLVHEDFLNYVMDAQFDYIISIQIFQHGDTQIAGEYFSKTVSLLKPGGLLFLRVNSTDTEIFHKHSTIEKNKTGGFTIRYQAGPKADLKVHFYSKKELEELTEERFEVIIPIKEVVMRRKPPKTGQWSQWEGIWRLR